jgi:hypothetical protein
MLGCWRGQGNQDRAAPTRDTALVAQRGPELSSATHPSCSGPAAAPTDPRCALGVLDFLEILLLEDQALDRVRFLPTHLTQNCLKGQVYPYLYAFLLRSEGGGSKPGDHGGSAGRGRCKLESPPWASRRSSC